MRRRMNDGSIELKKRILIVECWNAGALECQSAGVLEPALLAHWKSPSEKKKEDQRK